MKKTLLVIALLICSFSYAQDYFFNGSIDSDPTNPLNWDASMFPPNIATGTINTGEIVNILPSAIYDSPSNISLNGTIINEGIFTLPTGWSTFQDGEIINKGTGIMTLIGMIDGFGTTTITNSEDGVLNFIGVDIFGFPGTIFNINNTDDGQIVIDSATSIYLDAGSSFSNENNAILNNSGSISLNSAQFTNTNSAVLNNLSGSSFNLNTSSIFDNLQGAAISTTDANFNSYSSTINNYGSINNYQSTNLQLNNNSTLTNFGTISNYDSSLFDIKTGSILTNDSGTINNNSSVVMTFNSSTFNNNNSGFLFNYGNSFLWFIGNAVGNINDNSLIGNFDNSTFYISVASFNNQGFGNILNNGTSQMTINQSFFYNRDSSTLSNNENSTLTISGGGTLTNDHSAIINNQNNATLNLNAGSVINNQGYATIFNNDNAIMNINYQLNNTGNATFTNNSILNTNSSINNYGTISGTNTSHNSAISNFGIFSPGNSPGKYTVDTYINNTSGIVNIEIEGLGNLANAGITYDTVDISGNRGFAGGTLNVTLPTGYDPAVGEEFTIFTSASGSGNFDTVNLPTLADKEFVIDYTTTEIKLTVQSTLGLDELNIDRLSIYPNPANSQVTIDGIKEPTSVDIYSITGKKIMSETFTNYNNTLNISNLASGMYIFKVNNKNYKIIKQ